MDRDRRHAAGQARDLHAARPRNTDVLATLEDSVLDISARIVSSIDRFSTITGKITAWLALFMVLVTCIIVVLRYVFDLGFIWLQESVTWMHAMVFMLGAAYTLRQDDHVRVDVFYRDLDVRRKAIVDAIGVLFFLLPLCVFIGWSAWDFVLASWKIGEASRESGGLPYPMVPLLKSVLVLMPVLLGLQGISLLLRSLATLTRQA